jgi:hypothetical protein
VGFEISGIITIDGEEQEIEIDIEGPGIADQIGDALEIVPDGEEVAEGQVVAEVKLTRVSDEAELLDDSASDGTLTVELLSGESLEGGIVIKDEDGAVGITGELRFSASDSLTISATANCGENDVEELVSAP